MKNALLLFALLLSGCDKKDNTVYPLTEKVWTSQEVLHVPDNVGFYTSQLGIYYQFKSDGTYTAGNGTNNIGTKWYWIEDGVKFKVDYEGQSIYNDVFTIISMSDTLLHVQKRIEGEPEGNGNYWEIKYRPVVASCDDALKAMNGKLLFSRSYFNTSTTKGEATLSTDFIQKMDISIESEVLDTLLHYTYTCTEVPWTFGNIAVIQIFDTDGKAVTTQPGVIELTFGDAMFLFQL